MTITKIFVGFGKVMCEEFMDFKLKGRKGYEK